MQAKIKRPISVWVTQTIVATLALVFMAPMPMYLLDRSTVELATLNPAFISGAAIWTVIAILLLICFWGLTRRRPYGRWMAVSFLILLFFVLLVALIPVKYDSLTKTKDLVIVVASLSLFSISTLLLILRLCFGKRVSEFFNQTGQEASIVGPPPPPPSFDA